jgi:hypothetical protein
MITCENEIQRVLKALNFQRPAPWPRISGFEKYFSKISTDDSFLPLIYFLGRKNEAWLTWPAKVRGALNIEAKKEAILELHRRNEFIKVSNAFRENKIPFLIFKGTALSYTIYPQPGLRPHCDTDVWIHAKHKKNASNILEKLGYLSENTSTGEQISYQIPYCRIDSLGYQHVIDLHWELSNVAIFSQVLPFEEAFKNSVKISALEGSKTLSDHHSLLVACMHRVAHHFDTENLLWLYDIHILSQGRNEIWFQKFYKLAKEKKVWNVCARGFQLSSQWHGTRLPKFILNGEKELNEPSDVFLNPNRKWIHDIYHDLRFLRWSKGFQYMVERVFPDPAYMLKKYSCTSKILLPTLYLHRILRGLPKIFSRLKP